MRKDLLWKLSEKVLDVLKETGHTHPIPAFPQL